MRERGDGGVRPEAVLAVFLIISVLLLIFTGPLRDRTGRNGGNRILLSTQSFIGNATQRVKDGFGALGRLREMRKQYEAALERLGAYKGLERDFIELKRQNEELKALLGFSMSMEDDHIPARVIAGDPTNIFSTITIDKGTADGIRIGMPVTAFQDGFFGLLGKVVTVGTKSAQVRPLVDPDNYVAARMQQGRFEGLVQGRGDENGELLMKYVRKSAGSEIGINDLVVTSGMQSVYPTGVYLGRVKELRSREYSTSLELILTPIIDVSKTEYVFVLGLPESEGAIQ